MKPFIVTLAICLGFVVQGQPTSGYQVPPKEILELADVELAPRVAIDSKGEYMVLLSRNQYVSLEELSESEMRLAGLRINPITNIGSRTRYTTNVRVKRTAALDAVQVEGLPQHPRLSGFRWSHDERKMAFLHTTSAGVEVWVLDLVAVSAKKLTPPIVNANKGSALHWFKDDNKLLIKTLPKQKKPLIDTSVAVPTGPTISIGDGSKARNITYQDLLKTASDEFNFEQLALSEL